MILRPDAVKQVIGRRGDLSPSEVEALLDTLLGQLLATCQIDYPDLFWLSIKTWYGGDQIAAGGLGVRSQIGIFNGLAKPPTQAQTLVVVDSLIVGNPNAAVSGMELRHVSGGSLGATANVFLADRQFGENATAKPTAALLTSQQTVAVQGTRIGRVAVVPANSSFAVPGFRAIISNNETIAIDSGTDNQLVHAWFEGYELELRPR